jgi:hypothetical protein
MFTFKDGPFRWVFSHDSKLLVTSHGDRGKDILRTWDLASGEKVAEVAAHRGHPGDIMGLACAPDGGLFSTCNCCTVLRWQKSAWQGK